MFWGTGKPKREVTYIDDLAEAILVLMMSKNMDFLINIGSGYEKNISQYAKIISKELGYKGKIIFNQNKKLDGTPRKIVSSTKIKKLGWKSKTNFSQGLKLTVKDFLKKININ